MGEHLRTDSTRYERFNRIVGRIRASFGGRFLELVSAQDEANDDMLKQAIKDDLALSARFGLQGRTPPTSTWDTDPQSPSHAIGCRMLAYQDQHDIPLATIDKALSGGLTDEEIAAYEEQFRD